MIRQLRTPLVLTDEQCSYDGLVELGSVELTYDKGTTHVRIVGFETQLPCSCRELSLQVLTWARDVLDQQIAATKLAPGTMICSVN